MGSFRQYIFSLMCMSVICALLPEFFENGSSHKKLTKFAAGIITMIVALAPLMGNNIKQWDFLTEVKLNDSDCAISLGQEQAALMRSQIISERIQTYICDKATSMGANLSVEVLLTNTEPPIPCTVVLTGTVSPYTKSKLSDLLTSELAISEDQLQWN